MIKKQTMILIIIIMEISELFVKNFQMHVKCDILLKYLGEFVND